MTLATEPDPAVDAALDADGRARWLLLRILPVAIVLVPALSSDVFASDMQVLWLMSAISLAVVAVAASGETSMAMRSRPPLWALLASAALAVAMVVGLVVHAPPTQLGVQITSAAVAGFLIASAISSIDGRRLRSHVAAVALGTAAFQGLLMAAQQITEHPLLLRWMSDRETLTVIDGLLRPRGTLRHPFEPALLATAALAVAFVAVGDRDEIPRWWAAAVALATLAVGLSYSRAGVLGCVAALAVLILLSRRRRGARVLIAGIAVGLAATVLLAGPGWADKIDGTIDGDLDEASQGRWTLIDQALPVIADHPVAGVGPGRFQKVLETDYPHDPERPFNPHNLLVHSAAELGIPAAAALAALLAAAAIQAFRGGGGPAAAFVVMVPWLLFDILYYDTMIGQVTLALWLGSLAHAEVRRRQTSRATRSS